MKKSITDLVSHPRWVYTEGMLVFPHFKTTQKVRLYFGHSTKDWLPDLEDRATLSILSLRLIEAGGELRFSEGFYHIGERLKSKNLKDIICEGLLEAWGHLSDS